MSIVKTKILVIGNVLNIEIVQAAEQSSGKTRSKLHQHRTYSL